MRRGAEGLEARRARANILRIRHCGSGVAACIMAKYMSSNFIVASAALIASDVSWRSMASIALDMAISTTVVSRWCRIGSRENEAELEPHHHVLASDPLWKCNGGRAGPHSTGGRRLALLRSPARSLTK